VTVTKKTYEKISALNKVYKPLFTRAKKCRLMLQAKNVDARFVWANGHYEEYKHKYIREDYPIPVIEAEGVGDVGFNITGCFYEGYFSKDKLLSFDFDVLKDIKHLALYGESDYLTDIYNSDTGVGDVKQLIQNSTENNIAVGFPFPYKDLEKTVNMLILLTSPR